MAPLGYDTQRPLLGSHAAEIGLAADADASSLRRLRGQRPPARGSGAFWRCQPQCGASVLEVSACLVFDAFPLGGGVKHQRNMSLFSSMTLMAQEMFLGLFWCSVLVFKVCAQMAKPLSHLGASGVFEPRLRPIWQRARLAIVATEGWD